MGMDILDLSGTAITNLTYPDYNFPSYMQIELSNCGSLTSVNLDGPYLNSFSNNNSVTYFKSINGGISDFAVNDLMLSSSLQTFICDGVFQRHICN